MDAMLQKHGAKHIFRVPEGLRELCTDISREVLRSQPQDIYCFIADYVDALLITRENAKVAVRVVNNIIIGSESIVGILYKTGLSLQEIAVAAPKIQKAFRSYLDAIDAQSTEICDGRLIEEDSRISIRNILEVTGTSWDDADRAATIIQKAFRGHYERMMLREAQGEIQWQRAVMNTLQILKKAGASQEEATDAAKLIQSAYRGYYTRRNIKMKLGEEGEGKGKLLEPRTTIQAVAWLDMMYEDSGLTPERAHEAATVIQKAYRRYRQRRYSFAIEGTWSRRSLVAKAIVENIRQRVFDNILTRQDIPEEFGTKDNVADAVEKIHETYKERLRQMEISAEDEEMYESEDSIGNEAEDADEEGQHPYEPPAEGFNADQHRHSDQINFVK
ncbi:uncharacterized protein LOC105700422 [Orussus abietinus]|uniref:uncharacterized protein LOC105700422 n=1 Tax=Orussus abietinus TaxID=222816 RepID=UPI0006253991|nr:uncharacterized protein LOC105700422 [Orussus abietinus]